MLYSEFFPGRLRTSSMLKRCNPNTVPAAGTSRAVVRSGRAWWRRVRARSRAAHTCPLWTSHFGFLCWARTRHSHRRERRVAFDYQHLSRTGVALLGRRSPRRVARARKRVWEEMRVVKDLSETEKRKEKKRKEEREDVRVYTAAKALPRVAGELVRIIDPKPMFSAARTLPEFSGNNTLVHNYWKIGEEGLELVGVRCTWTIPVPARIPGPSFASAPNLTSTLSPKAKSGTVDNPAHLPASIVAISSELYSSHPSAPFTKYCADAIAKVHPCGGRLF